MHKLTNEERAEAQAELRKILQGTDTIKTLSESRGMTEFVRLFIVKHNDLQDITWNVAVALGEPMAHKVSQPYGIKRTGGGYNKEFDVVYTLGRTLYPKGYKHTVKGCHSNDHVNHGSYDNTYHRDGGYKFAQRSI